MPPENMYALSCSPYLEPQLLCSSPISGEPYHLMLVPETASVLLAVFLMAARMRHGVYLCRSQACDLENARGHCIKLHFLCIAEDGPTREAHICA